MDTILFKSYYLTKSLYWLIGLGIVISTLIFLDRDIAPTSGMQISCAIVGFGSMIVLYLNRLEPHYLKLDKDEFTIAYMSKLIFKRNTKTYAKKDIKVLSKDDDLILYDSFGKCAVIRQKALEENKDWDIVKKYFLN